jgi:hypothetical protein
MALLSKEASTKLGKPCFHPRVSSRPPFRKIATHASNQSHLQHAERRLKAYCLSVRNTARDGTSMTRYC